ARRALRGAAVPAGAARDRSARAAVGQGAALRLPRVAARGAGALLSRDRTPAHGATVRLPRLSPPRPPLVRAAGLGRRPPFPGGRSVGARRGRSEELELALTVLQVGYPLAPTGPDAVGGAEQVL